MNKKLIALFSGLFYLSSYGQSNESSPYLPTNTSWTEVTTNSIDGSYCRINRYFIDGDTVINSVSYKKIFRDGTPFSALRESEKKVFVYFFDIEKEKLTYDFDWAIGKTLYFQPHFSEEYAVLTEKITEIDKVRLEDGNYYDYILAPDAIIKGIGSQSGFFSHMFEQPPNGDKTELLCFKKKDILIYKNIKFRTCESCEKADMAVNNVNSKNLVSYCNNTFYFSFDDNQGKKLFVYDSMGGELFLSDISNKSSLQINTLKNGVYFYKITARNNKTLYTGSFIYKK